MLHLSTITGHKKTLLSLKKSYGKPEEKACQYYGGRKAQNDHMQKKFCIDTLQIEWEKRLGSSRAVGAAYTWKRVGRESSSALGK